MKKTVANKPPGLEPAEIDILVHVLALTDALWSAPRIFSNPATCLPQDAWAAVTERRSAFESAGLSFHVGGNTQQRKESERLLGDLESKSLLALFNRSGRRWGVRLTEAGDDIARWFAAEELAYESWPQLAELRRLVAAKCSRGPLVREDDLAKVTYGTKDANGKLFDLEAAFLPLKARGLIDDAADRQGHCYYALTSSGEAAAVGPRPTKPKLPEYQTGYSDTHTELVEEYRTERITWKPGRAGAIHIPLSCGIGPDRSWKDLERAATARRRKPKR